MFGPDSAVQSDQQHEARRANARALMAEWAREDAATGTTSTTDTAKAAR